MNSLNELLAYYHLARAKFLKQHNDEFVIKIPLTLEFLQTCEERIRAGSRSYGDDWKRKDCIKERDAEVADYFNYSLLDMCQRQYKYKKKKSLK